MRLAEGYYMSYARSRLDSPDPSKNQTAVATVLRLHTAPRRSEVSQMHSMQSKQDEEIEKSKLYDAGIADLSGSL